MIGFVHARFVHDPLRGRIAEGIRLLFGERYGKAERDQIVRRNLTFRYQHLIAGFLYPRLTRRGLDKILPTVEGTRYLDETIEKGRGAILLLSHFGLFGLLVAGLVLRDYRLRLVLALTPPTDYRTWRWIERAVFRAKLSCWMHERVGLDFWQPGMYLRPLYRRLIRGEIVALFGDGARGGEFVKVNFMGHPLLLSSGPFRIAARAEAALIPAFIVQEERGRHRVVLEAPIVFKGEDSLSIQEGAARYASLLARYVEVYPDHWFSGVRLRWVVRDGERCLELAAGEEKPSEFYQRPAVIVGRG
jgi:lauroyl/myristoyl acyltransferase